MPENAMAKKWQQQCLRVFTAIMVAGAMATAGVLWLGPGQSAEVTVVAWCLAGWAGMMGLAGLRTMEREWRERKRE